MRSDINCLGLAGGICTIVLIVASLFVPWWQLTVGENLLQANWSPLNTNFNFAGDSFTVPLVLALNISSIILLAAGGIVMLIYSLYPAKPYSKKLLGFAYKKPLYSLVLFLVGLIAIILLPKLLVGLEVPLSGSVRATLPSTITQTLTVSVLISAGFQWTFGLAIVAVSLCIAARFYHNKVVPPQKPVVPNAVTTTAPPTAPAA